MMQPTHFPAEDPNRLWILVAGRSLTKPEGQRWYRAVSGGRRVLPLLAVGMLGILALSSLVAEERSVAEQLLCALVVLVGLAITVVSLLCVSSQNKKQREALFAENDADRAAAATGSRIAFYSDRVEMTTLRGTFTVPFAEVTSCVETADGFSLATRGVYMVIRGQDLTPFDAGLIHAFLQERIAKPLWRMKAPVMPFLAQPLPIPRFPEPAQPFRVAPAVPLGRLKSGYRQTAWLTVCMLGIAWMAGAAIASLLPAGGWPFPLLLALVTGIAVAACLALYGVLGLLLGRGLRKQTMQVVFEPDGLRLAVPGGMRYIVKNQLWVTEQPAGITVQFVGGGSLFMAHKEMQELPQPSENEQ